MQLFCSLTKLGRAKAHIVHGRAGGRRHRAHGTPAAHCHRRSAHRGGQPGSTAADLLRMVPVARHSSAPQASCRTVPSAQADGAMPASGTRHAAAHCRRRSANRGGQSGSTAADVLFIVTVTVTVWS